MTPNWKSIYAVSCHQEDRDGELIAVTRETLRLASHALRKQNEEDYYHNYGAAEQEIIAALSLLSARGDEITGEKEKWQAWARKRLDVQRKSWLRAARAALNGDMRELRTRVELAEAPPLDMVQSEAPHAKS
jgi:hypothetical protein